MTGVMRRKRPRGGQWLALVVTAMALVAATVVPAVADHHGHGKGDGKKMKDIVGTAAANEQFSTLVAAIKAAGLVEALQGEGPFTVFAPTNEAFAKLPEGTLETLLKPENKAQLQAILKYHVVSGRYPAARVVNSSTLSTLQGADLSVEVEDEKVMINNAQVIATDVKATNGVIHVIDTVLLPPSE